MKAISLIILTIPMLSHAAEFRLINGRIENPAVADGWEKYFAHISQVVPGGYILDAAQDKTYFLTNYPPGHADGDRVFGLLAKEVGLYRYTTVMGATRTIRALDCGTPAAPPQPARDFAAEEKARQANFEKKKTDALKLLEWQKKMAAEGHAFAQRDLGKRYLSGDGVPKDLALAKSWLEKAASQSDSEAQTALASLQK